MDIRAAIGDYLGFFRQQRERLTQLGIDISGLPISATWHTAPERLTSTEICVLQLKNTVAPM